MTIALASQNGRVLMAALDANNNPFFVVTFDTPIDAEVFAEELSKLAKKVMAEAPNQAALSCVNDWIKTHASIEGQPANQVRSKFLGNNDGGPP